MGSSFFTLLLVIGSGPATVENALGSVFVKALPKEQWTTVMSMDEVFLSALFGDGCDPGVSL